MAALWIIFLLICTSAIHGLSDSRNDQYFGLNRSGHKSYDEPTCQTWTSGNFCIVVRRCTACWNAAIHSVPELRQLMSRIILTHPRWELDELLLHQGFAVSSSSSEKENTSEKVQNGTTSGPPMPMAKEIEHPDIWRTISAVSLCLLSVAVVFICRLLYGRIKQQRQKVRAEDSLLEPGMHDGDGDSVSSNSQSAVGSDIDMESAVPLDANSLDQAETIDSLLVAEHPMCTDQEAISVDSGSIEYMCPYPTV